MNLTDICIKKPVFAWMLMAATVVFGGIAATRIGISQFPDVDFPTISVNVTWEGAAPEVVEHDVIEILEEAVVQVEGVRSITSSSRQGGGNITVELDLARNVDLAMQDVQSKVSQAQRRLPRDIDPPVISKTNPEDQPIMWVGLSGPFPTRVLSDFARYRLKEKLQTVPGIGEITMGGFVERNIRVWLDATRLDEKGLTVTDVIEALQREHVELPAGRIETEGREVNVRILGEALDLSTFRRIIVGNTKEAPVYLEDVALVEDGFEDVRRLSRVAGAPAQGLGIKKQRGANAVALAEGIRKAMEEIRPTLPEGMELGVNFDSTRFIEESVHEVEFELVLAVILTAVVCWLFLGSLSSTLNVVLAIPMSLLGTIATIYFLGFTLNTFTLLALSLAVGIVVDDAIMILENIFRHSEEGKDRVRAAREGTEEIKFAALAATLAVIAIFIPVIFMKGIIGRFFLQFGITLSVAVLLSYLEAITLAPARCAQFLSTSREGRSRLGQWGDRGFEWLSHRYSRLLARGLKWPVAVLSLAAVLFAGSFMLMTRLPRELVPSQDQSRMLIRMQTAVGSNLAETDRIFHRAEAFMATRPEVARAYAIVGGFGGGGVNTGVMFVTMVPPDQRDVTQQEFAGIVRKEFNSYPGVRAVVQDLSQQGFTAQRGFPVEFSIRGPEWDRLVDLSQEIRQKLTASGAVIDLDTDYQVGMPELRITPDRARAADLGISVERVAQTINAMVGGLRVGRYSTEGRRIDVRLRLLADQRSRPEDLSRLRVRSATDELIPLSSLVTYEERPALQAITRSDRERAITFFANVAPGRSQDEALTLVKQLSKELPIGYHAVLGGASVAFQESMGSLIFAILLGIIVAYMILASQFNSLLHPVTVLTILPLSIVGAAIALLLAGKTLNIFSMIGLLLLMGIVKKNSIILVDYANQIREEGGGDAATAMLRAGPVRLRPILMTSASTLMAAVPAALALGSGSEIRSPMAMAVIGGLIVSTVLSLFVVPAFYVVADQMAVKIKGWRGGRRAVQPVETEPKLTE
ncbi:MAG: efflux RND transporter permease subunit [Candidatus Manganitrophus sp.]|nr:efflux RND transporter permease subunit [Candidatus Manganitrophus sp.]MDC4225021.1 efflux RND transporter permease subunit [Candidatus Manganitrophus sp.]WDT71715.1 MAG: efflux RND transporter permease subunit [Candidatus Manganitrophus sp.]WDT80920.1 MAG: efflux RND transporter permease subunit [Candidatus Manganitrophus sp.]